jgi:AcrR family transcriptional regulator
MPYRRTESVVRRLAEREEAIIDAACAAATDGGMDALQMAPVAQRAGVAAGTIYRYFPSKSDLVAELIARVAARELAAMQDAATAMPGPLSALAASISTFATRCLRQRKLAWAVLAEPIDSQVDAARREFRKALAGELKTRIEAAIASSYLPPQDAAVSAPAVIGAVLEGLIGPLGPNLAGEEPARSHEAVQTVTLLALRALGVIDARARGVIVALPNLAPKG